MVLTDTNNIMAEGQEAATLDTSGKSGFDSSDDEGDLDLSKFPVSWLELDTGEGDDRLAISALPGCRFKDTWRSLENDIKCLTTEGIHEVFCLLTRGECSKYRVPTLLSDLTSADILVHHYAFMDGQTPSMGNLLKMIDEIKVAILNDKKPLVFCFGGLGRSCLVAVCAMLVMDESLEAEKAIDKVRTLRGPGAIQSVKQYNFVCEFRNLLKEYRAEDESEARSISR